MNERGVRKKPKDETMATISKINKFKKENLLNVLKYVFRIFYILNEFIPTNMLG
jgi:hypothetical protein